VIQTRGADDPRRSGLWSLAAVDRELSDGRMVALAQTEEPAAITIVDAPTETSADEVCLRAERTVAHRAMVGACIGAVVGAGVWMLIVVIAMAGLGERLGPMLAVGAACGVFAGVFLGGFAGTVAGAGALEHAEHGTLRHS